MKVSEDVIKAKSARKNAKGSLTRVANQLRKQLVLEPGEKYNFLQLDKFSIEEDAKKLQTKLSALQECNEAYSKIGLETLYKAKAADDVIVQFEDEVDSYWIDARQEATKVLNSYKFEYSTALDRYLKNIEEENKVDVKASAQSQIELNKVKKKAETDIRRQINRWKLMKTEWFCIIESAEKVTVESTKLDSEALLKRPILIDVATLNKSLKDQWDTIKDFLETLWDILYENDTDQDKAEKLVDFDINAEAKRMHQAATELGRLSMVVQKQSVQEKEEVSSVVKSAVTEEDKTPLKMDKIQTPKFSGKAEDFASWKEKFSSLVPKGRVKAETAILLEQAVPEGKRYLLRGCGDDYEKMFTVLQKELAPTRDVINSINLQLSKLKKISPDDKESDRKFVNMVESIEKMERDLTAINRVSVLANCNTIQEIEGKLPHLVKTDWFKRKREKGLDEEEDQIKFKDFLSFLIDYKYIAKDGIAEYERAKAMNAKSYTALVTG